MFEVGKYYQIRRGKSKRCIGMLKDISENRLILETYNRIVNLSCKSVRIYEAY